MAFYEQKSNNPYAQINKNVATLLDQLSWSTAAANHEKTDDDPVSIHDPRSIVKLFQFFDHASIDQCTDAWDQ